MSNLQKPFDFSQIVGYPNDIPDDVLDNVLNFQYGNDACAHVKAFGQLIDDWDDSPICEDALMRLFSWTLLVDDSPPDSIEELKNIILNMQYAHTKQYEAMNEQFMIMEDQLEILEANFTETYIEYPDPHELELDSVKDKEVHRETLDEYMDESVNYFEEVKEFEFENVEYLDNSSPHPPPVEPISLEENIDNLEENSIMVPLTCSFPTSQPKEDFVQNSGKMEGNFGLSMSYHYEYWLAC
jgi:hypothetical protein